ncbi:hypothetical protein CBM2608_B30095 [Cupriavidus taiwanensis]|nr:hypothetical protein CBM2608_B30095 [Cupriavidus taiwanensis]
MFRERRFAKPAEHSLKSVEGLTGRICPRNTHRCARMSP